MGGTNYSSGFWGLRSNGANGLGITGGQYVCYNATGTRDVNLDASVMLGVGNGLTSWSPPPGGTGGGVSWDADARLATGTYAGSAEGPALSVQGLPAFGILPDNDDGKWKGPATTQDWSSAGAIVTQTLYGQGNSGGTGGYAAYPDGARMDVLFGTVRLAQNTGTAATASTPAVANLDLHVQSTLVLSADQDLRGLTVDYDLAGVQGIDLNSPNVSGVGREVRVYPQSPEQLGAVEAALIQAIIHGDPDGPTPYDGIYDSGKGLHPNSAIGVAVRLDEHNDPYVVVKLTRQGDLDCDGAVDALDYQDFIANWQKTGKTWDQGDIFGRDGAVDALDYQVLMANWGKVHTPEPGTIALLSVGIVGLSSRRRGWRRVSGAQSSGARMVPIWPGTVEKNVGCGAIGGLTTRGNRV
jgi:hypothetical protein